MPYALLPTTRRLNAPSFAPHSSLLLWLSHLVDSRRDENSTVHTSLRRAGTTSTKDRKLTMTYPAHCVRPFITPGLQQVSTQARNVDHRRFPNYLPTFYQGPPPERCFRLPLPPNGTVVESTRPRAQLPLYPPTLLRSLLPPRAPRGDVRAWTGDHIVGLMAEACGA